MSKTKWFSGRMHYPTNEVGYEITLAKIDGKKLWIDWIEQGYKGGLEATSEDGRTFRGNYNYQGSTERGTTELELIHEYGSSVLRGFCCAGEEAWDWEFRLTPRAAPKH